MRAAPILLGVLLAGGGCSNAVAPETEGPPSQLSFGYQGWGEAGTISGSYRVEGDPYAGVELARQSFAVGHRLRTSGAVVALSGIRRGDAAHDFAWVSIPRLTPGAEPIHADCTGTQCTEAFIAFDTGDAEGSQARFSCSLRQGSVRIVSISGQRVVGEFGGTGTCIGSGSGGDLEQFSVTGGRFDLRLRDVPG